MRSARAFGPPVETPMATMSTRSSRLGVAAYGRDGREGGGTAKAGGGSTCGARPQNVLIFGISCVRMHSNACAALPTLEGLVT
jgi:hypothetical protein